MTTADIPVGSTVFVRWYGKIVQAEVSDRKPVAGDGFPVADWVPVLMTIPGSDGKPIVPGVRNICLFHMTHVYASAQQAQQAEEAIPHQKPVATVPEPSATVPEPSATVPEPSATVPEASATVPEASASGPPPPPPNPNPSESWQAIQKFKQEHWDQDRNRLRIDALEAFYLRWRAAVAAKRGITTESAALSGSPAESHPVPKERHQKQKMLTKKQLRSSGRIEFTDSIQTSLFD